MIALVRFSGTSFPAPSMTASAAFLEQKDYQRLESIASALQMAQGDFSTSWIDQHVLAHANLRLQRMI